eukprot:gene10309-12194_t
MLFTGHKNGSLRIYRMDASAEGMKRAVPITTMVHRTAVLCVLPADDGLITSTKFGTIRFWPRKDITEIMDALTGGKKIFKLRSTATISLAQEGGSECLEEADCEPAIAQFESTPPLTPPRTPTNVMITSDSDESPSLQQRLGNPLYESEADDVRAVRELPEDISVSRRHKAASSPSHPTVASLSHKHTSRSSNGWHSEPPSSGNNPASPHNMYSDFEVHFDDVTMTKQIGSGSYGCVYRGIWRCSDVAVKVMNSDSGLQQQAALEQFRMEAQILASLRSPNVVLFMGACTQPPNVCMALLWPRRIQLAMDVAIGMNFLHTSHPQIVHRDLKSPNILISSSWSAKIGDLGLSKLTESGMMNATASINSPRWMAPEVLKGEDYNASCDVYSFGVIMWEICTNEIPWADCVNPYQLVHMVADERRSLPLPEETDPPCPALVEINELIKMCLSYEPSERPAFDEIVVRLRKMQVLAHALLCATGCVWSLRNAHLS